MGMDNTTVLSIICLCIDINHRASEIYIKLSKSEDNEELKHFWTEMANEEEIHATFWDNIKKVAQRSKLPLVFDDPQSTQNELEKLLKKVEMLLTRWEKSQSLENALILAYRLEYYMLHPAIEMLYHTLKPLTQTSHRQ